MHEQNTSNRTSDLSMRLEYAADLGDKRRTRRAQTVGLALAKKPELSLPKLFTDEADLEAAYRLLRNPSCHWGDLLAPHARRTVNRGAAHDTVLVAHDTTTLSFRQYWSDKRRAQMASLSSRTQGFLLHASFAVSGGERAEPLGVVEAQPFVHVSDLDPDDQESHEFWEDEFGLFDNEKERWFRGVALADDEFAAKGVKPVHIMDQEADSYGLMSWMAVNEFRFIVRVGSRRRLKFDTELHEVGQIQAKLGDRFNLRDGAKRTNPDRRARHAQLTVSAGIAKLSRVKRADHGSWTPDGFESQPLDMELYLVEAVERDPPQGEQAIRWLLMTTEPIDTADEVLRIVEWYRRRWMIEEYFKALKSGCRIEDRQMVSAANMLRILALLLPAAWRLLLLRTVASHSPNLRWSRVLTPLEFRLLSRVLPKARLGNDATVAQCMAAIARLGGHLPRNGRPGWQSLQARWRQLQDLTLGARLAQKDAINP